MSAALCIERHAHYSPDGKHIVWMSSYGHRCNLTKKWPTDLRTDFWIMDADGDNKRRLTHFNDPTHPDYVGPASRVICGAAQTLT